MHDPNIKCLHIFIKQDFFFFHDGLLYQTPTMLNVTCDCLKEKELDLDLFVYFLSVSFCWNNVKLFPQNSVWSSPCDWSGAFPYCYAVFSLFDNWPKVLICAGWLCWWRCGVNIVQATYGICCDHRLCRYFVIFFIFYTSYLQYMLYSLYMQTFWFLYFKFIVC